MQIESNTIKTAKLVKLLPIVLFGVIAVTLYCVNAFPALSGDEYGSMVEKNAVTVNLHAVGYFIQLNVWSLISNQDWFLRSLSLVWLALGLYWFNRWLSSEKLESKVAELATLLAVTNPFLWIYGYQIRFYAYFFAASVLFIWRFRVWQREGDKNSSILLGISTIVLLTAHLFGGLVLASALFSWLWIKLGKKWPYLLLAALMALILIFIPTVRQFFVELVLRITNSPQTTGALPIRGVNPAMLAKIPFTIFFFLFGERVYPLWLWITIPGLVVAGFAFLVGCWKIYRNKALALLLGILFLNIPFMYLVLDPIAPPGLQGAAPRYLIYVLPAFLLVMAVGSLWNRWVPIALLGINLAALYFLAFPAWSYGGGELTNWPYLLTHATINSERTCFLTDGRAKAPVSRYAPVGAKLALQGSITDCTGYDTIVMVSNDFRLAQVRYFDEMAESINKEYSLVSNQTFFPTQITKYQLSASGNTGKITPSRLDLPEQDLRFPIQIEQYNWYVEGFVRLDQVNNDTETPISQKQKSPFWVLTNFRTNQNVAEGTPVFSVEFIAFDGRKEQVVLHSGKETSSWASTCLGCTSVYSWKKLIHLVGGGFGYDGAYDHYNAKIWGFQMEPKIEEIKLIKVTYLLPEGTGYYFGVFP